MSNATYNKYWLEGNEALYQQLEYESPKDANQVPKDRETALQHLFQLYVRYIQIYRKLEDSLDQMLHPQKRRLLKEVVVAVMGRILEIKHHIVDLDCSDYHYFNDVLLDLKLTPDDIRIPVPRFIKEIRKSEITERQTLLEQMNAKDFSFGDSSNSIANLSLLDAIKLIQVNERGRQGRLRAKYMREIKLQAQREKEMMGNDDEKEVNEAALKIQRLYKGYRARKLFAKMLEDELTFLGMAPPPKLGKKDPVTKSLNNRSRRKLLQDQYEEDYLQALISTKEKILKVEGPDMKEAIQDDFRQWYMEQKRTTGKFPEFPPEEVWQKPGFKFTEHGAAEAAEENQDKGDKDAAEKPVSTPAGKDKKKGGKGEAEEEEDTNKFKFDESEFLKQISSEQDQYNKNWRDKDESENFTQKHDQEIIKANKRREVEAEIKKDVFQILEDELKNLKLAVEREKAGKGKKGKAAKKGGGKKGKKEKGGKKGKKEKDITANRTMESLVEELVQTGILQKYTPATLSSFHGELNLMGNSTSKDNVIFPSVGDNIRILTEFCLLPMGIDDGSLASIPKVSSMLLFGPRGSGKSHLVRALASELGAQVFNLSPRNTAGQFVGKSNVTKMVHMAFKVARAQGPSIIFIDTVEMVFAKKVPKDDTSDPKRIKKDLLKNIKSIKEEGEKVIFIGASSKPWDCDVKAMMPLFEKFLFCPKPDYNSRIRLWKEFIAKKTPDHLKNVNVSQLTRMSEGFSAGTIHQICERVLTDRRIKQLRIRPLRAEEFIEHILSMPSESKEEDALFKDFLEKTPLLKKRIALQQAPDAEEADSKKAPAKKK